MIRRAAILLAACLALATHPAAAQTLAALEEAEAAFDTAWAATPLSFRKAIFATDATDFGVYNERGNASFKPGEPIVVYAEPVGYGFRDNGDGTYSIGFDIDLAVKTAAGEVVAGKDDFANVAVASRARSREFRLSLTLDLGEAPAGDYVLEYTARDIASPKTGTISLPFAIVE